MHIGNIKLLDYYGGYDNVEPEAYFAAWMVLEEMKSDPCWRYPHRWVALPPPTLELIVAWHSSLIHLEVVSTRFGMVKGGLSFACAEGRCDALGLAGGSDDPCVIFSGVKGGWGGGGAMLRHM